MTRFTGTKCFLGHQPFSVSTGKVPGKLEQVGHPTPPLGCSFHEGRDLLGLVHCHSPNAWQSKA